MLKKVFCLMFVVLGLAACKGGSKGDHDSNLWLHGNGAPGELAPGVIDTVYFGYDSSTLSAEAKDTLKKQAEWWKSTTEKGLLQVEGHCDERGTREYNLALGERRAHAAKKFLISQGVAHDKVETVSYGKEKPSVIGHGDEVWAKNRRDVTVRTAH